MAIDAIFDASRHVVLPGLVNTHHHFYQTLTRAHPKAINKELFDWLKALYPVWARLTPESLRLATRLALAELLMSGVTTTSDHHYVFPKGLDDAMDIQVDEARRLGMRMTVTRGSMNLSVKDGGLPPDSVVQDEDEILADCERVIGKYHQSGDGAMIQVALAPCSPFSVTRSLMCACGELAARHDCRLHTHLAETHDEDEFCKARFGMLAAGLPRTPWDGSMAGPGWPMASIFPMRTSPGWAGTRWGCATARPPTWCWPPGNVAHGTSRRRARRLDWASMDQPPMTAPTSWRVSATRS